MKNYKRITYKERDRIARMRFEGKSFSLIAKRMKRSVSSITREVHKYENKRSGHYEAALAERKSKEAGVTRRYYARLNTEVRLRNEVIYRITELKHSPEQVSKRLKLEYPADTTMHISPETIYRYIYIHAKGELRYALLKSLRRPRKGYKKGQKRLELRGQIPNMVSIDERPSEIENRLIPGHWEGDLIVGKGHRSALGTLTERSLRYTLLVPLENLTANHVAEKFAEAFKTIPADYRKSMTYDQGKEMSRHLMFTELTNMPVYFCHPHSPWERGTNENTNGLIRQFFPKGIDFTDIPASDILYVQHLLNTRPRKVLNYSTPTEALEKFFCDRV